MNKINSRVTKIMCEIVFDDLGFYFQKKYRVNYVSCSDFYGRLLSRFSFLSDNNLIEDFDSFLFNGVLKSLHFNYITTKNGDSFFIPYRKKDLKKFLTDNTFYKLDDNIVSYFSNGKIKQCFINRLY